MRSLVPWMLCALSGLDGSSGDVQGLVAPPAQLAAMKKLDLWVGEWKGSGWSAVGSGGRLEFDLVESVQRKIGGTVLFVEGRGTSKPGAAKSVVTHDGIALLSFDESSGRYRWTGHELGRGAIDADVRLVDGGFEWSIRAGGNGATLRFTILLDAQRWREVGELNLDGRSWNRIMEMALERQGDSGR